MDLKDLIRMYRSEIRDGDKLSVARAMAGMYATVLMYVEIKDEVCRNEVPYKVDLYAAIADFNRVNIMKALDSIIDRIDSGEIDTEGGPTIEDYDAMAEEIMRAAEMPLFDGIVALCNVNCRALEKVGDLWITLSLHDVEGFGNAVKRDIEQIREFMRKWAEGTA